MGYWSELRGWLFKDPGKLLRYAVLFTCLVVVVVQLTECYTKLRRPPISTHSYYRLNESIEMPAVTVCRDPPYKEDVMSNITQSMCLHPKYTTCWRYYPFDEVPLDEFFENSTYDIDETFRQYGLDGDPNNVEITSSLNFYLGRCHTLRPKRNLKRASKNTGYSMILKHHIHDNPENNVTKYYESEPGWHLYIHDIRENFTEIHMKGTGRVQYVFAELNEEIEIKLEGQYFSIVQTNEMACEKKLGYSDLKCGEVCVWEDLCEMSNCSGPWMTGGFESLPPCADYKSMRNLTTEYAKLYHKEDDFDCQCVLPCETSLYSTYIQNRKEFFQPDCSNTQVWIYYTTKIVSMIQERPGYDSTQFIADIGGSLGFLLGLSVLGIIGMLEHITLCLFGGFIKKIQKQDEKHKVLPIDEKQSPPTSEANTEISTIYKSYTDETVYMPGEGSMKFNGASKKKGMLIE